MGSIVIDGQYDECRKKLKETLSAKRYNHSIGVSNTAACLAMVCGYNVRKAHLAGLLHDCAKGAKDTELLDVCKNAGLELSEVEICNPDLLHAKAGKFVARDRFGIDDEEILDSIFYHTTGRCDMTLLEKIIFVADYIEPNRSGLPGLDMIRRLAFEDIDAAVALICRNTLDYLKDSSKSIDPNTLETYRFYSKSLSGHENI